MNIDWDSTTPKPAANFRKTWLAASVMTLASMPLAAFELEEIVVTAQKRSESLQEVPIAIQAFSAQAMENKGLSNVTDIANFAPNVELDSTSPFSGSTQTLGAFIRGIGQADFAFNLEPGVGVYVDGVYYSRAVGSVVGLLDLERIEVLKGPQGTLFGRNTIGGALNVITRRPAEEFGYQMEVTIGEYDRMDVRGAVDIPLIDNKLYSQVSFSTKSRNGYHKRIDYNSDTPYVTDVGRFTGTGQESTYDRQGGENNQAIRAKLLWTGDNVDVLIAADYTHVNEASAPNTLLATFPNDADPNNGLTAFLYNTCLNIPAGLNIPPSAVCETPRAVVGTPLVGVNIDGTDTNDRLVYSDAFITGDIDTTYGTAPNYSKMTTKGIATTVDWDLGNEMALKSITAYRTLETAFGTDVDGSPIVINDTGFYMDQEQLSQEFLLTGTSFDGALNWVTGLYYFHEEGGLIDYPVFGSGLVQIFGPNDFDNDAYAAFVHLNYDFTENFSGTLGVRYTKEDKQFFGAQRDLNSIASLLGFPAAAFPDPSDLTLYFPPIDNQRSFENVSPKLGLEYRIGASTLTYASVSKGFKSGGWTTRATVPILEVPQFDEEEATSYEIGVKTEGDTYRINTALFYTDYENLQISVQKGLSPFFENAAQSEIQGLEVDFEWLPAENFTVSGAYGYIDAQYKDIDPTAVIREDFSFNNTPKNSASLSALYQIPMDNGLTFGFMLDHSYHSNQANDAENTPELFSGTVRTWNGAITLMSESDHWDLALGAKNLTDERYIVSGFRNPGAGVIDGTYSRPREWYLTFRVRN